MKERLAELVSESCDGELTPADVLAATVPLAYLGVTSLAQMRLIDAIEREYDVEVDLSGDVTFLDSVDGLAAWVEAARAPA
ncbi:acyl carrier protein [Herbidospora mongoliensis]|uniref:acyl carrier protein n=1 Tax=Herbidospora mongoliensis TaxID=688067 RepID=UPI00082CD516|nr:acyl carrier protein [Herbidospora mongoliensis]